MKHFHRVNPFSEIVAPRTAKAYGARMDGESFKAWRQGKGWSQQRAADELGVTKRSVIYWEKGTHPVTRLVELACEALDVRSS